MKTPPSKVQPRSDGRPPRSAGTNAADAPGEVLSGRLVDPRGRSKTYRPMAPAERAAALDRGLAAYARGAFYLAHEELEPAWMGTTDPGERELLAGLIKLAAAFVHASRGNPAGVQTNLRGARERLAGAAALGAGGELDLGQVLAATDDRLRVVEALVSTRHAGGVTPGSRASVPDPPHDVAGPHGRARGAPLDLDPPAITRTDPAR